jgi:hypothetical protein
LFDAFLKREFCDLVNFLADLVFLH